MNRNEKEKKLMSLLDKAIHLWYKSTQKTNWLQLLKMKSGFSGSGIAYRHLRFINHTILEIKISSTNCPTDKYYQVNFHNKNAYEKMLKDLMIFIDDDNLDVCINHWEEKLKPFNK